MLTKKPEKPFISFSIDFPLPLLSACLLSDSSDIMASMIGTIIAHVAVFEIHIDNKLVGTMKAKDNLSKDVPITLRQLRAILLCSWQCSIATATVSPVKH